MSRTFILLGLILVAVGLIWPWNGWLRLERLLGDIVVERQNFTLYFPVTSGLLISVALTLFLSLVSHSHRREFAWRVPAGSGRYNWDAATRVKVGI